MLVDLIMTFLLGFCVGTFMVMAIDSRTILKKDD